MTYNNHDTKVHIFSNREVVLLSKIVFVPLSYLMKRQILYIAFLFVVSSLFAEPFYTHVTVNNIRTLQVRIADNPLAIPVIELG